MPKSFFLFICCVFTLIKPSIGFAWAFTEDFKQGYYWGSLPIDLSVYASSASEGDQLSQLTQQAQQEWENTVGREIWSLRPGYVLGGGSGNHIRWSDNFAAETGYDPSTTLAVTVRYSSGTYFSKVVIILNGGNNALRTNSQNMLKKTILHELGHTFGLDHSQQYSIMGANLSGVSALTYDDAQGSNAAVDENLYRQQIGYVSPLAKDSGNKTFAACGSVALLSSDDSDGPGPGSSFVLSLLIGLSLAMVSAVRSAKFT
ncbi:MAG: hypothetical protein CME71_12095 [Halobacteriovorax sp.]|nr:hypothetical protein [Halobacteriovorax sp.]